MKHKLVQFMLAAVLMVSLALSGAGTAAAAGDGGAVYTLTNAAAGNEVVIFNRAADGTLMAAGTVATGGLGTGGGLGSQGALTLSKNGKWLFAVSAGSNDVAVFAVSASGLTLVDKVASGGERPISVTNYKNVVYVLNAGGSGNITGFTLSKRGKLTPIADSTRNLSNNGVGAAPGPAQIEFSPDGEVLVVTEKATNLIDTYAVDEDGLAGSVTTHPSAGVTPFGFAFTRRGTLIVSEAAGGAVNASSASSYDVSADGFELISAAVPTNQTAACWVVVTKNGKYAYTTNTGSGSISGYRVSKDGSISLVNSQSGLTGTGSSPIDAALSRNSQYLYTLNAGAHTIAGFGVNADGSLISIGGVSGLIAGAVGLAAW
ncbi:MAG: beta-propeller fold lactonase family protein [Chloroflexi bacterium]|nr:beta-propeller fold lactonase family protein [Chloroflexota bacterium]